MILYNEDGKVVGEIYEEHTLPPEPEDTRFFDKIKQIFKTTPEKLNEFNLIWTDNAESFGIVNRHHEDMLLATILSEVGQGLESRRENLNYTPTALRSTFSRYKRNPNWSERDGRTSEHQANQRNIGNIAYADRLGNGPIDSGDGYKFRGGGYIQTTGRYNWEHSAKTIQMLAGTAIGAENLEESVDRVSVGVLMTFAFFFDNNIASCPDMNCCTDKVNRYTSSREQRNQDYNWISGL